MADNSVVAAGGRLTDSVSLGRQLHCDLVSVLRKEKPVSYNGSLRYRTACGHPITAVVLMSASRVVVRLAQAVNDRKLRHLSSLRATFTNSSHLTLGPGLLT
jgi:hypothetical protein